MNKWITIVFVVCPIIVLFFVGLSIGAAAACLSIAGIGALLIYTFPTFLAEKKLYEYEMECNIINVLQKASFNCDAQQGWLNIAEIFQAVNRVFDDKINHSDQFYASFQQLKKLNVIVQKRIKSECEDTKIDRLYKLNKNSKYRPKKPRRHLKNQMDINHAHA